MNEHELIQLIAYTEGIFGEKPLNTGLPSTVRMFNKPHDRAARKSGGIGYFQRNGSIDPNDLRTQNAVIQKIINSKAMDYIDSLADSGNERAKALMRSIKRGAQNMGRNIKTQFTNPESKLRQAASATAASVKNQFTNPESSLRKTVSSVAKNVKDAGKMAAEPFKPAIQGLKDAAQETSTKVKQTLSDPKTYINIAKKTGYGAVSIAKLLRSVLVKYPEVYSENGKLYAKNAKGDKIPLALPIVNRKTGEKTSVNISDLDPSNALARLLLTVKDPVETLRNNRQVDSSGIEGPVNVVLNGGSLSENLNKKLNEAWWDNLFGGGTPQQPQYMAPQMSSQEQNDLALLQQQASQVYNTTGINVLDPNDRMKLFSVDLSTIQNNNIKSLIRDFQKQTFETLSPTMQKKMIDNNWVDSSIVSANQQPQQVNPQATAKHIKNKINIAFDSKHKQSYIADPKVQASLAQITTPVFYNGRKYDNGQELITSLLAKNTNAIVRKQDAQRRIAQEKGIYTHIKDQMNASKDLSGHENEIKQQLTPGIGRRIANGLRGIIGKGPRTLSPQIVQALKKFNLDPNNPKDKDKILDLMSNMQNHTSSLIVGRDGDELIKIDPASLEYLVKTNQIPDTVRQAIITQNNNINKLSPENKNDINMVSPFIKDVLPQNILQKLTGKFKYDPRNIGMKRRNIIRGQRVKPSVQTQANPAPRVNIPPGIGSVSSAGPMNSAAHRITLDGGLSENKVNQKSILTPFEEAMICTYLASNELQEDANSLRRLNRARQISQNKRMQSSLQGAQANRVASQQPKPQNMLAQFDAYSNSMEAPQSQQAQPNSRLGMVLFKIGNGLRNVRDTYQKELYLQKLYDAHPEILAGVQRWAMNPDDPRYKDFSLVASGDLLRQAKANQRGINAIVRNNPENQLKLNLFRGIDNPEINQSEEVPTQNMTPNTPASQGQISSVNKPTRAPEQVFNSQTGSIVTTSDQSNRLASNGYSIDSKSKMAYTPEVKSIDISKANNVQITPDNKLFINGLPAQVYAAANANNGYKFNINNGNLIATAANGSVTNLGPTSSLTYTNNNNILTITGGNNTKLNVALKPGTPTSNSTSSVSQVTIPGGNVGSYNLSSSESTVYSYLEFLDKFNESVNASRKEISPRNMYHLYLLSKLTNLL